MQTYTLKDLKWDTDYFGVACAKAELFKTLTLDDWLQLSDQFEGYDFISITNYDSDPYNARLIGTRTTAFLADVNVQLAKDVEKVPKMIERVSIYQGMHSEDALLELAKFPFSRFSDDPILASLGGDKVYRCWIENSFEKPDKFFAISVGTSGDIEGFLLHSYCSRYCRVELIGVSDKVRGKGIGTMLFRAVEQDAYTRGCEQIRVGTQSRNLRAINFYHKLGCRQVGCHQVYHLWMRSM